MKRKTCPLLIELRDGVVWYVVRCPECKTRIGSTCALNAVGRWAHTCAAPRKTKRRR